MSDQPDGVRSDDPADGDDAVGRSVPRAGASPLAGPTDAGVTDTPEVADAGEDADAAVVREPVGAAAGSARAAARRSGATRLAATPAKSTVTRARDTDRDDRGSLFAQLGRFFREVVAELRKVIWPARNQMVTYTIVVIVFVVFMVALVYGLDALFAKGVLSIFG